MEKQAKYYKIVSNWEHVFRSLSLDSLTYEIGERTVPPYGKLFLFSSFEEAKEYIPKYTSNGVILEGTVDGEVYSKDYTFGLCVFLGNNYDTFWKLLQYSETKREFCENVYKYNKKEMELDKTNYPGSRLNVGNGLPSTTVFSDDFTPTRVMLRYIESYE